MASQTLALHADWIVPIVPANVCLENHTLVIQGNIIKNILPTSDWNSIKPRNDVEELFLKDKILIPGLINSHTHAAMALFANCADDTSFQSWLFDHIWPLEKNEITCMK